MTATRISWSSTTTVIANMSHIFLYYLAITWAMPFAKWDQGERNFLPSIKNVGATTQ